MQSFQNVVVAGTPYNVAFFDRAFLNLTATQQVPTFRTESEASAALSAITSAPGYAALAGSTTSGSFTRVVVPFSAAFARNSSPGDTVTVFRGIGSQGPAPVAGASNFELDANMNYNFAGITLATFEVANVPEPGSFAVLAFGLFGLGWARRRFT